MGGGTRSPISLCGSPASLFLLLDEIQLRRLWKGLDVYLHINMYAYCQPRSLYSHFHVKAEFLCHGGYPHTK